MRALLWLASVPFCIGANAQDFSRLDAAAGKALFERNWVGAPASTAAADGLGPYYNARSCAACHAGGGGSSELSAMNLMVDDAQYAKLYGELVQLRALPGLQAEARAELSYTSADIVTLADGTTVELFKPLLVLSALQHGGVNQDLAAATSLRRAPALAGLAWLDKVPLAHLLTRADPHDRNGDGISGSLPEGNGRFGWKAGAATLREQIARALSLDLGLGNPLLPAASGDCTPQQVACLEAARAVTGDKFEAPDIVLDLLLAYLRTLPMPPAPASTGQGAALFSSLGCVACHTPQLQTATQVLYPYSDLLLHDMGAGLAAPADSKAAKAAEWRTAPLWGLRQVPRFLHDGRAATLEEAILWHGGEAAASADAYRHLNASQRAVLNAWLLGL